MTLPGATNQRKGLRMLETIDARAARQWAVATLASLGQARGELDALNVYPVPDGDTGTNLYLTVEAAVDAVRGTPANASVREVIEAFAHGALMGARGNSGIIAAQLMRGWADVLAEHEVLDAAAAKKAMVRADEQAWAAVAKPVEGTILSVSRAGAQAAATAGDSLPEVITAIVNASRTAVARTREQLPALRAAGVVDAGARGYLLMLEALQDLVQGRTPTVARRGTEAALPAPDLAALAAFSATDGDLTEGGPAYEVMYLLDAPAEAIPTLRSALADLGDSLVVVGGGTLWNVHVHVDDPGAAVEAGIAAGRPHRVRITHFAEQIASHRDRRPGTLVGVGLVAVAAGPGLADIFAESGAEVVYTPGRRPSTGELLAAVRACRAQSVVILPNDGETMATARAAAGAARGEALQVTVLPTRAQVQGLAAAAVHDPGRSIEDDVVSMTAAAGATRDGAVTIARREALTMGGLCRPGDALGIVGGDIVIVLPDLAHAAEQVVHRLVTGGAELLTLVRGQSCEDALIDHVTRAVRRQHSGLELLVLDGGQPSYTLLIGAE